MEKQETRKISKGKLIIYIGIGIFLLLFAIAFIQDSIISSKSVIESPNNTSKQTSNNTSKQTLKGKVSISDIDKLADKERLVAKCSYSHLISYSFIRSNLESGKSKVISVEVLDKDQYGRYITEFIVNAPFNQNYNMDYRYWIIIFDVKEDGNYKYLPLDCFFTNEHKNLDTAKKNAHWNEPLE